MGFEDEDEEDGDEVVIVPQTVKASPGLPARASEDDKSSFKILCRAKSFFSLSQLSVWITSPPPPPDPMAPSFLPHQLRTPLISSLQTLL